MTPGDITEILSSLILTGRNIEAELMLEIKKKETYAGIFMDTKL